MTATNMCSNFGGKWASPPLTGSSFYCYFVKIEQSTGHVQVKK